MACILCASCSRKAHRDSPGAPSGNRSRCLSRNSLKSPSSPQARCSRRRLRSSSIWRMRCMSAGVMFCRRCARDCKSESMACCCSACSKAAKSVAGLLVDEVVLLQPLDGVPNITRQRVELRPPFLHEFFHLLHSAGFIGTLLRRCQGPCRRAGRPGAGGSPAVALPGSGAHAP